MPIKNAEIYLGESKIRVSNPTLKSGAELSLSSVVIKSLGVTPGEDAVIWYVRSGEVIVRKKKREAPSD